MTEYKSKDIFGDVCGFLHRHPRLEGVLGVDINHVIVDVADWEAARTWVWISQESARELLDILRIITMNAVVGPAATMNGTTDCYHVPIDDIEAAKRIMESLQEVTR